MRLRGAPVFLLLAACGPQVLVPVDDSGATGTSTTAPDPSTTIAETGTTTSASTSAGTSVPPDPTTMTGPDITTEDPDTTDTDETMGFIQDPETSCSCADCDLWAQDCGRGEKCMPWANDGGNSWNASRCVPLDADPDEVGDPCTVEGSGVSGIDTCGISSMCWNVDPETNAGTCVGFCEGSPNDPSCPAACDTCSITNDGVLILCLEVCDPSAGACPDGQVCSIVDPFFLCISVGETVGVGEVCDAATPCADGLRCAGASELPSCAGESCCAPWCSEADADPCAAMPGTTCQGTDFGEVPGCVEGIGYCAIN